MTGNKTKCETLNKFFIYSGPVAGIRAKMVHETTYFTNIKMACEEHMYVLRFKISHRSACVILEKPSNPSILTERVLGAQENCLQGDGSCERP